MGILVLPIDWILEAMAYTIIFILLLVVVMAALVTACKSSACMKEHRRAGKVCSQPGWVTKGESCYLTSDQTMTWRAANEFCKEKKGFLVEIVSSEEQEMVNQILEAEYQQHGKRNFWMGLQRLELNYNSDLGKYAKSFFWNCSESRLYNTDDWEKNAWGKGEPDGHWRDKDSALDYPENCGAIDFVEKFQWIDDTCGTGK